MSNGTNDEYDEFATPLQTVEPAKLTLKLDNFIYVNWILINSLSVKLIYSLFELKSTVFMCRILDSTTSTAWRLSINQASLATAFSLCSACRHILMAMKYLIWNQESPNMCFCCYLNKSSSLIYISRGVFLSIYNDESDANTHANAHAHTHTLNWLFSLKSFRIMSVFMHIDQYFIDFMNHCGIIKHEKASHDYTSWI